MNQKFFILGLPRSRTAWLSAYFGCLHEALRYFPNYDDFLDTSYRGDSTTVYHEICHFIDDYPKVFIHRPVMEVYDSIINLFGQVPDDLLKWDEELHAGDGLHVEYQDINKRLPEICEFIGLPYNKNRDYLMNKNIQNQKLIREVQSCLLQ